MADFTTLMICVLRFTDAEADYLPIDNTIDARAIDGTTALMIACNHHKYTMINKLIMAGANKYLTSKNGYNACMLLLRQSWPEQIGYTLLDQLIDKANINACSVGNDTVLSFAVQSGDTRFCEKLITLGADPSSIQSSLWEWVNFELKYISKKECWTHLKFIVKYTFELNRINNVGTILDVIFTVYKPNIIVAHLLINCGANKMCQPRPILPLLLQLRALY